MRLTYAIYLELSLDKSLPGFFDEVGQYGYAQKIDRGSVLRRREIERLEFENVQLSDEPKCRQVAEVAGYNLVDEQIAWILPGFESPVAWREFGRVVVQLVEHAANPEWTHGMGGENPAVLCPKCQKPMIRRQGNGRPFWGCSEYPTCRGSRAIAR